MKGTFSDYLNQIKSTHALEEEITDIDLTSLLENNKFINNTFSDKIQLKRLNWSNDHNQILNWCLTGFNVLLYGYGSKRNFLNEFVEKHIKGKYIALIIRGYFKQIKFKNCLIELLKTINEFGGQIINQDFSNEINDLNIEHIITRIQVLHNKFSTYNKNIFIIIHNIDSLSLRPYLSTISQLAHIPNISVVSTVDNIRWPLLWSNTMRSKMNFLYKNISTLEEYDVEFEHLFEDQIPPWLGSLEDKKSEQMEIETFYSIINCLTPSHIQLTKVIANLQLENNCVTEDLLFNNLKCSMIVTNKNAFSQLLIELFTHDILTKEYSNNKLESGSAIYKLKLSSESIREFLNNTNY